MKYSFNRLTTWLAICYVLFVSIFMLIHRLWFSPDQFFVFVILAAVILGRTKEFIKDWTPLLLFYLSYEFLRGLIPFVSKNVHIWPMINADEKIFGYIPAIKLQELLYVKGTLHWFDYVAVFLYICHFVTPLAIGFLFWVKDRSFFKRFSAGLLVLSYSSFITYLVFPAMPPWMAADKGLIPPVQEIISVVMSHFLPSFNLPSVYSFMGGNPVAAMPSLHAAFPTLVFLFIQKWSKRAGLLFSPYVMGVWFAVMYLGEHYFIDVVVGVIYALAAYLLVERLYLGRNRRLSEKQLELRPDYVTEEVTDN